MVTNGIARIFDLHMITALFVKGCMVIEDPAANSYFLFVHLPVIKLDFPCPAMK